MFFFPRFIFLAKGKSPLVVMEDVDLNEAVEIAHNAVFANRQLIFSFEFSIIITFE